ncbi:MarR family winged helix-turn-helix transcriptional regulator [Agrococcus sp. HG114]|uniref:MarR family winged helix-turn-helix transcriptional regulator n=1 Tax=Agrococcus sp. HG114 TaxID=2969757 RepID=UPI00215A7B2F|nr:MarR family transcriptional regulator [Agrococcus sp. HG114]MCR8670281.1 MarR family transcriptional regulator [Agrococcus sp. HG114]
MSDAGRGRDALALQAWREYFEGSRLLENELERRLKDAADMDLGEFNILLVLDEAEGSRMRMGDLARALAFAPGRLTYRVAALEEEGLVRREQSPADRRGTEAVLTDAGRRRLRKARPIHARHVDELFLAELDHEAVEVLHRVFGPLRTTLLRRQAAAADPGQPASA